MSDSQSNSKNNKSKSTNLNSNTKGTTTLADESNSDKVSHDTPKANQTIIKPQHTSDAASPQVSDESSDGSSDNAAIKDPKEPHKTLTDISLIETATESAAPIKKSKRTNRWYQLLLVLALIAAFIAAMVYQTLFAHLSQPAQRFEVEEGQSYYGLLNEFQSNIPLFSNSLAKLYIKTNINTPLNAGTYDLPENPTFIEFLNALQQGEEVELVQVQIIEGKTAKDLYQVLANTPNITLEVINEDGTPKDNLKQALGINAQTPTGEFSDNLEGWFTPNTYHYGKGATDTQILTDLYTSQQAALNEAWENRDPDLPYASAYEALIMASIIEKETGIAEEREQVAAVFVNRLRKGMRLQTDPTIIYGMGDRYDGNIRRQDIDEATAYNTYQIDGLPPTPIALPSKASIEAALHPADIEALYFVATGTGGHKFSNTLAEHNQAVQDYLKVMREQRAGE